MTKMPITSKPAINLKISKQISSVTLITCSIGIARSKDMEFEIEAFVPKPKPQVRYYGSAAGARGRRLANILEFSASSHFFLVVIQLPQVQFCNAAIEWVVNGHGGVTIEGQITPAAIFANIPIGQRTKRIKLCPSEPWGMSFYFPGPVDWWTASVLFTSETVMEITVMKATPVPVPIPVVPIVPIVPVLPLAVPAAGNPAAGGSPTRAEIDAMLAEWLA